MPVFWGVVKGLQAVANMAALKSRIMAIALLFCFVLLYNEVR